jgi:hypothetical protein
MRWDLHGLIIEGTSGDARLAGRWERAFASLPAASGVPHLRCRLDVVTELPAAQTGLPAYSQGDWLAYYLDGSRVVVYFPAYGRLDLDLAVGKTRGELVRAAVETYGVLEDVIAIGLSPHLRRRGLYLLHAFAAARDGRAVILVGESGSGKSTTGLTLLADGWRLLANDSPLVVAGGRVLSYPGLLSAYPDTFARFPPTAHLAQPEGQVKLTVPAEAVWPGVWVDEAAAAAICFLRREPIDRSVVDPIGKAETLGRLMPHAAEQWDSVELARQMAVLRDLAAAADGYVLHLGARLEELPELLAAVL